MWHFGASERRPTILPKGRDNYIFQQIAAFLVTRFIQINIQTRAPMRNVR